MPAKSKNRTKATTKKKTTSTRSTRKKPAARRPRARAVTASARRQDPESLRLRTAGPSFTVDDLALSLRWYRDILGLTLRERWEHEGRLMGCELVAGNVSFYIGQDDWKKGRGRVKGEGFRLYCTTAQDVDALAAQIKARGGTLLEEPHDEPWGTRAFAVVDPDGFKITISRE